MFDRRTEMKCCDDPEDIEEQTEHQAERLKPNLTNLDQPEMIVKRTEMKSMLEQIDGKTFFIELDPQEHQREKRSNQKEKKKKEKQRQKEKTSEPKTVEKKNKDTDRDKKIENQMPFPPTTQAEVFSRMMNIEIQENIDQKEETVTSQIDSSAKRRSLSIVTHPAIDWFKHDRHFSSLSVRSRDSLQSILSLSKSRIDQTINHLVFLSLCHKTI